MVCFYRQADFQKWWSLRPIDMFAGAPVRLLQFISRNRLMAIISALRCTKNPAPTEFVDKFHDVRELIDAFNDHYSDEYLPSWINVLDESMNTWLNKYAPGFMCVPRKPHPFGNEYHSIADGDDGKPIMWQGKDRPKLNSGRWAFPSKYANETKTAELMLFMTKPIQNTGKDVCMDSGFCIATGIIALHKKGVYGQSLIKKQGKYWPKHVQGSVLELEFLDSKLGVAKTYVQTIENTKFLVHCHKDDRYVSKIMSTHGLMTPIEDHTTYWHDPIGLEQVWATIWWPQQQVCIHLFDRGGQCLKCKGQR
ncbi:hypothetical protein ACHAW6_001012 [Cyclotella cf. meneghiniana]